MNDKLEAIALTVMMLIIAFLAFCLGLTEGAKTIKKNAIEAGVAHYTVNPTNGMTQFEFKAAK